MTCSKVLCLLLLSGDFLQGFTDLIKTQQTVTAAVGHEATLNCQLMKNKEVHQVTWWKILPAGEKILASNHKIYHQNINPKFRNKVDFKVPGLQNSSIVIRDVTEEDEGCYLCMFEINKEDDVAATTCLQVYELHEPILTQSQSAEETLVSCSATGRPAPTVTLGVLQHNVHFSNYTSVSETNTNATVTVTTTAVLPRLHDNSRQVVCSVRVLSGPQIEEFVTIPELKQPTDDGFDEKSVSNNHSHYGAVISVSLVVCLCAAAAAAVSTQLLKKENKISRL